MSDYANTWKAAKTKFENDTGGSKPTEKGKVIFIEFRKSTNIDSRLEKLDKLLKDAEKLEVAPPGILPKAETIINELRKNADEYINLLNKEAAKEKSDAGKTALYRSLKILRSSLDEIAKKAQNDLARAKAGVDAKAKGINEGVVGVFKMLQSIRAGIEANCAKAISRGQALLQNPTPQAFNAVFPTAARDLTQQVGNLYKYSFPLELTGRSAESTMAHLEVEPKLWKQCISLQMAMRNWQKDLAAFTQQVGDTPANASLYKMANDPPQFAATATGDTVKVGIKNFLNQVKFCMKYAEELKKAGM